MTEGSHQRARDRADRIKKEIPIAQVLSDYGYDIHVGDWEQQFSCDLHGDGHDQLPSARIYPEDNQYFCFACGKQRDSIEFIREKEGMEFHGACALLEKRYGLPVMGWSGPSKSTEEVDFGPTSRGYTEEKKRIKMLLESVQEDREVDVGTRIRWWEAFDAICWQADWGDKDEKKAVERLTRVRTKVMRVLKA